MTSQRSGPCPRWPGLGTRQASPDQLPRMRAGLRPGAGDPMDRCRHEHPGQDIPGRHVFIQPAPGGPKDKRRDQVIFASSRPTGPGGRCAGPASRSPRQRRPSSSGPIKRSRFISLDGATKRVNCELEAKARTWGAEGHVTYLAAPLIDDLRIAFNKIAGDQLRRTMSQVGPCRCRCAARFGARQGGGMGLGRGGRTRGRGPGHSGR